MPPLLAEQMKMIDAAALVELAGAVQEVRGLALRVADLPVPIGSMVRIHAAQAREPISGEVVGFDHSVTLVMPFGATSGVRRGDRVVAEQFGQCVPVSPYLRGRVVNGLGQPIDGKGPIPASVPRSTHPSPVDPLDRPLIDKPLATGVRAIDALLPVGQGQRLGVFAAPGVGKSTLLATMARHTSADIAVVALIGERGREVRDFVDKQLGELGMANSVVVCATSDEPALMRIRAALVASTIAEYFRDQGLNVLFIMDSVTRFCQAQRQVGLSIGEPPATKGYPPSVFASLPLLLERAGRTSSGSITGFYAVLVEGDDMNEPISDAARGILDGHILLSRALATRGHYPAIDVLESISRVADDVIDAEHQGIRREVVRILASYRQVEDLLNIGAYAAGSNPDFDLAIAAKPVVDQLLQQGRTEVKGKADFERTRKQLIALGLQIQQARRQLPRAGGRAAPATANAAQSRK